jgi:4'-phosphopantetheinyl transferase EntD
VIQAILPASVAAAQAFSLEPWAELFPQEEAVISGAVAKRRTEFATVRRCARTAMRRLGLTPAAILPGPLGAPVWPPAVVGSMTHCDGYLAAALAMKTEVITIGIDAEPNLPLPAGVAEIVTSPQDLRMLADLGRRDQKICWDRLAFTIKESIYKAWFPLTRKWLDFKEAEIWIDPGDRTFTTCLHAAPPVSPSGEVIEFSGRWLASENLLIAAIAVIKGHS